MDPQVTSHHGPITLRLVKSKDARTLQHELETNREWLSPWEATVPGLSPSLDMRQGVRRLLQQYREGGGVPFVMEYNGEIAGQLNIWGVARGSLSSATIGYWVSERFAGKGVTPTCVAMASDIAFQQLRLHRMEICIRPENTASLRVVQKLGFRYEGLRKNYIHIDGGWRDHYAFALTAGEVSEGVMRRWVNGSVPESVSKIVP